MSVPEGVEGDFLNFQIRIVREEEENIVLEHLKANFFQDEPHAQLTGYSDELAEDISKLWRGKLSQNLSLIAMDKTNNEVAGVTLTMEHRKGEIDLLPVITSTAARKTITLLSTCDSKVDFYDNFGVDRYAELFLVSIGRGYRSKGLAFELCVRSIALLKSRNFPLVECVFTHPHTRRNGEKLGFQELFRMKTIEATSENGEVLFPNAGPDQIVTLEALQF